MESGKAAGEGGTAERGGDAPEERGGGDVEVAADGFAGLCRQVCRLQQKTAAELCAKSKRNCRALLVACTLLVVGLSAVVGSGFGVDQDAEQFRKFLFETDFQFGGDIVHAG